MQVNNVVWGAGGESGQWHLSRRLPLHVQVTNDANPVTDANDVVNDATEHDKATRYAAHAKLIVVVS